MKNTVNVLLTGELLYKQSTEDALGALSKLFKLNEQQAKKMLAKAPLAIKKNVDIGTAERFVTALERLGLGAYIEHMPVVLEAAPPQDAQREPLAAKVFESGGQEELESSPQPILNEQARLAESLDFDLVIPSSASAAGDLKVSGAPEKTGPHSVAPVVASLVSAPEAISLGAEVTAKQPSELAADLPDTLGDAQDEEELQSSAFIVGAIDYQLGEVADDLGGCPTHDEPADVKPASFVIPESDDDLPALLDAQSLEFEHTFSEAADFAVPQAAFLTSPLNIEGTAAARALAGQAPVSLSLLDIADLVESQQVPFEIVDMSRSGDGKVFNFQPLDAEQPSSTSPETSTAPTPAPVAREWAFSDSPSGKPNKNSATTPKAERDTEEKSVPAAKNPLAAWDEAPVYSRAGVAPAEPALLTEPTEAPVELVAATPEFVASPEPVAVLAAPVATSGKASATVVPEPKRFSETSEIIPQFESLVAAASGAAVSEAVELKLDLFEFGPDMDSFDLGAELVEFAPSVSLVADPFGSWDDEPTPSKPLIAKIPAVAAPVVAALSEPEIIAEAAELAIEAPQLAVLPEISPLVDAAAAAAPVAIAAELDILVSTAEITASSEPLIDALMLDVTTPEFVEPTLDLAAFGPEADSVDLGSELASFGSSLEVIEDPFGTWGREPAQALAAHAAAAPLEPEVIAEADELVIEAAEAEPLPEVSPALVVAAAPVEIAAEGEVVAAAAAPFEPPATALIVDIPAAELVEPTLDLAAFGPDVEVVDLGVELAAFSPSLDIVEDPFGSWGDEPVRSASPVVAAKELKLADDAPAATAPREPQIIAETAERVIEPTESEVVTTVLEAADSVAEQAVLSATAEIAVEPDAVVAAPTIGNAAADVSSAATLTADLEALEPAESSLDLSEFGSDVEIVDLDTELAAFAPSLDIVEDPFGAWDDEPLSTPTMKSSAAASLEPVVELVVEVVAAHEADIIVEPLELAIEAPATAVADAGVEQATLSAAEKTLAEIAVEPEAVVEVATIADALSGAALTADVEALEQVEASLGLAEFGSDVEIADLDTELAAFAPSRDIVEDPFGTWDDEPLSSSTVKSPVAAPLELVVEVVAAQEADIIVEPVELAIEAPAAAVADITVEQAVVSAAEEILAEIAVEPEAVVATPTIADADASTVAILTADFEALEQVETSLDLSEFGSDVEIADLDTELAAFAPTLDVVEDPFGSWDDEHLSSSVLKSSVAAPLEPLVELVVDAAATREPHITTEPVELVIEALAPDVKVADSLDAPTLVEATVVVTAAEIAAEPINIEAALEVAAQPEPLTAALTSEEEVAGMVEPVLDLAGFDEHLEIVDLAAEFAAFDAEVEIVDLGAELAAIAAPVDVVEDPFGTWGEELAPALSPKPSVIAPQALGLTLEPSVVAAVLEPEVFAEPVLQASDRTESETLFDAAPEAEVLVEAATTVATAAVAEAEVLAVASALDDEDSQTLEPLSGLGVWGADVESVDLGVDLAAMAPSLDVIEDPFGAWDDEPTVSESIAVELGESVIVEGAFPQRSLELTEVGADVQPAALEQIPVAEHAEPAALESVDSQAADLVAEEAAEIIAELEEKAPRDLFAAWGDLSALTQDKVREPEPLALAELVAETLELETEAAGTHSLDQSSVEDGTHFQFVQSAEADAISLRGDIDVAGVNTADRGVGSEPPVPPVEVKINLTFGLDEEDADAASQGADEWTEEEQPPEHLAAQISAEVSAALAAIALASHDNDAKGGPDLSTAPLEQSQVVETEAPPLDTPVAKASAQEDWQNDHELVIQPERDWGNIKGSHAVAFDPLAVGFSDAQQAISADLRFDPFQRFDETEPRPVLVEVDPFVGLSKAEMSPATVPALDVTETSAAAPSPAELPSTASAPEKIADWSFTVDGESGSPLLAVDIPPGHALKVEAGSATALDGNLQLRKPSQFPFMRLLSPKQLAICEIQAREHMGQIVIAPAVSGELVGQSVVNSPLFLRTSSFVAASSAVVLEAEGAAFARQMVSADGASFMYCSGAGQLWFSASGRLVELDVQEDYLVNLDNLVAFSAGLDCDMHLAERRASWFAGRKWICRFSGEGKVWVQTVADSNNGLLTRLRRLAKA